MKTIRIGNTDHILSPEVFAAFLDIGARGDSLQQRVDDLEDENKTLRLAHELVSDGRDKAEARVYEEICGHKIKMLVEPCLHCELRNPEAREAGGTAISPVSKP